MFLFIRHTLLFVFLTIFEEFARFWCISEGRTGDANLIIFIWYWVVMYWAVTINYVLIKDKVE